jgi:hypothetical protein
VSKKADWEPEELCSAKLLVEANNSFPLALRISLLAAALLATLVWTLRPLGMFGDPLGGLLFGGETLDYFGLAIGPKNIDHPAKSGITFSRHESGSVFGHLANMCLRCAGSSRSSGNHQTDRNLRSAAMLHLRKPLVRCVYRKLDPVLKT